MRSSSVHSPVNPKSIAIATVLCLILSVAAPAAHAATRSRSGKSSVTKSESTAARIQRSIQNLINRLFSVNGELPSDPWPRIISPASATAGQQQSELPSDPWP
jgi:predicted PurR-regulated permease PerM